MNPDEIQCPECEGRGEHRLGTLRLACELCHGAGTTADKPGEPHYRDDGYKIPEEGEEYDPEVHGPLSPVGEHLAVTESGLCGQCLGAGEVATLGRHGDDDVARTVISAPCPACQPDG